MLALTQFFSSKDKKISEKTSTQRGKTLSASPHLGVSLGEASSARSFRSSDTRVMALTRVFSLDVSLYSYSIWAL
jgi:hypothetical protein